MTDSSTHTASTHGLSRRLAWLATRATPWVLLVSLGITAASVAVVRHLRIRANLVALLPASLPHVKNLNRVIEKTGGFGDVVVLAEGRDPEAAARYFAALLPAARKLSWVRRADYQVDTSALQPYAALYMDKPDLVTLRDRLQKRLEYAVGASLDDDDKPPSLDFTDIDKKYEQRKAKRKHERLFRSDDGRIVALRIIPQGGVTSDLSFGRRILGDVQRLVDARASLARKQGLRITVAGKFYNRLQDYQAILSDVRRSAIWGGVLILVLITLYFRHWLAFPLILIPLAMSLTWTFAITRIIIGHLNVITAFLFIILLGLGIDFGIHLFARYKEERRAGRGMQEALQITLRFTGRACLTSGLTTSAAFASLMITDFKGFSQFGFIAGLGVALAFLAMVLVLPALLVAVERIHLLRFKPVGDESDADAPRAAAQPVHSWARGLGLAALAALGLAVAGGVGAASGHIRFEYDFNKLNTLPASVTAIKKKTRQVFKHSTDSAVVFVDDLKEAAALEASVRRYMARDKTPTIKDVRSLLSLKKALPKDQPAKLKILAEIQKLLKKRAIRKAIDDLEPGKRKQVLDLEKKIRVKAVTVHDLPEQLRRPFYGLPGVKGSMVFIVNLKPLKDARFATAFVNDTRSFKTAKKTYYPASEAVVYAETISLLQKDGVIAVLASLVTVLLLLFVDFRRLGRTLLVFLPLAAAVGWLLLTMWLWPIALNMYNLVVLPSIIGLGIDNSVHFYHRYEELGPGHVGEVWRSILGPISATTLTTMVGFGGMISAHQVGLESIGILAVLGMGYSLLAVATFLPAILIWRDSRAARRAGSTPSAA